MSNVTPIQSAAIIPYVSGLQLSRASTTTLTIQPGICRDSTNTIDINLGNFLGANPNVAAGVVTTLNGAVKGINGLDTGTLANNTWYAVYVIADQSGFNLPATILSTNFTQPGLPFPSSNPAIYPSGYSSWKRIGVALTNNVAQFSLFYQTGIGGGRSYQWDAPILALTSGTATTFTAVNLSVGVPPLSNVVYLSSLFTSTLSNHLFSVRPTGSTTTSPNTGFTGSSVLNSASSQYFPPAQIFAPVVSGNPSVDYLVTANTDTLSLSVFGFMDSL